MSKIGFIGLGVMGKPMARNLLKAGYGLVVFDVNKEVVAELAAEGAEAAENAAAVASRADKIIITMLPNSPHVSAAVLGANGVAEGCRAGQVLVDMSSIAPLVDREIGAELAKKGVSVIDAPVSGGQEKAESGTLAIMAGGDEAVFNEVKPVLEVMGGSVTLVGELGAGQTTKLVNQMIVGINIAAVAEGMSFAKKAGVDPRRVFEAIRGGLAGSQCLADKAPRMFEERYNPGFRINLHIKDLWNVMETSRAVGDSVPLSALVMEMMIALANDGCETMDHGALGKYYEKLNKISLKA